MTAPQPLPQPDEIGRHLRHITRRWHELEEPCVLEVRCLAADRKPDARRFPATDWGLELAARHVAIMNGHGLNAYAVVNPIPEAADIPASKGAEDKHILASFFHWADADTPEASERIRTHVGPRPTMTVLTGSVPFLRPHVYWELEEPTRNLEAWTRTQRGIAVRLATDRAVVNPSRIMRIAGTVTWPALSKQAKGYISEVAKLRLYDEDERPRVTWEAMAAAYPLAITTEAPDEEGRRKNRDDYADMLRRMRTDGEKHSGVRDMAASLAGQGVKKIHAEAIIAGHCPVWDEGVEKLISSAYAKFAPREEPVAEPLQDWDPGEPPEHLDEAPPWEGEAVRPGAFSADGSDRAMSMPFRPWTRRLPGDIPMPDMIYSDFYARGYTSVTTAPPKAGKSVLALSEAVDMVTGRGFLTGVRREPLRVVYYNAEDDQNVVDARVAGVLAHHKLKPEDIPEDAWFPTSGVSEEGFYLLRGGIEPILNEALFQGLETFLRDMMIDAVILDPLQDLNRAQESNDAFRLMGQRLRKLANDCQCAVGLIHHTKKMSANGTASMDDMRGGSALRGTSRFNRLLLPMSEEEGAKAAVKDHRRYFRIAETESNLTAPSAQRNAWFEKVNQDIAPRHGVAVARRWRWPDAFEGVSHEHARRCQALVMSHEKPLRANYQSKDWAGRVLGPVLQIDVETPAGRAKMNAIINKWVETDVLRIEERYGSREGRDVPFVVAGGNVL